MVGLAPHAGPARNGWCGGGWLGKNGPSASHRAPKSRLTSSWVEPANVGSAATLAILCKSLGGGGTTSCGALIAEMQSDRLLSIASGVSFFVLLAIFPAITALVSAYGLFFSPSIITNNLSLLNDVVPDNVLSIVHEQTSRIAANSGSALSITIVFSILVSLWSAMSGVKAMIDALNVIYEQKETRSFIKLNLLALVFTLAGFSAFLLAIASIIVLPLVFSPFGFGSLTEALARVARWPVLLLVLLIGLAVLYRYGPDRRAARWQWVTVGSVSAAVTWMVASFLFSWIQVTSLITTRPMGRSAPLSA